MNKDSIKMSYIAGLMDGDGSFSICKLSTKANPLYFPVLQFVNRSKVISDMFKNLFGGRSFSTENPIKKDGSQGRLSYRWRIRSSDNVEPILKEMIPFLKIKRLRAEYLLDFIEKYRFQRGKILDSDTIEAKEACYQQMMYLNSHHAFDCELTQIICETNTDNPIVWSYIAGLMDTDGSFSIKKQVINKGTHVKSPRYSPVINLFMTDTRAINFFKENCNLGKIYIPDNKDTSKGFVYQMIIYKRRECIEFLNRVIPYLISKKENAKILLDFCKGIENTNFCMNGIPERELEFRENRYKKLINANKGIFQ